jgi:hypothetical protein
MEELNNIYKEKTTVSNSHNQQSKYFRIYQTMYFILGILEVLLAFRFIFKLTAANAQTGFVDLIYSITNALMSPFNGIFGTSGSMQGSSLEWSIFVAMLVYAVLVYGTIKLIEIITAKKIEEV